MPEPLTTLPGDIPGLRDEGTPITVNGRDGLIVDPDASMDDGRDAVLWVDYSGASFCDPIEAVQVRLTTRTGRAHAAAWGWRKAYPAGVDFTTADDRAVKLLSGALRFEPATPEQTDALCRLCLRLAGRAS